MAIKPNDPKTSSIGDRLWIDTNGNGVQDGSEIGLSGVTVTLMDATGKILQTTTSGTDGSYLFSGLASDVYQLQFGSKDGYAFTGTLGEAGIASLKVDYDPLAAMTAQNGNLLGETSTATRADGSSIAMVDVYFTGVSETTPAPAPAATTQVANKLASLLQPADDLLHSAFGHQDGATAAAATVGNNIDPGETLRQLVAMWNAHGQMAQAA